MWSSVQQIPDIETVVFRFCLHLRGVLKEGAQTAVLCPLRIRVVRRHIRGKEHIAQQGIDRGKGAFLLCRQLAVFLPEEEHIRVTAIGTAIELPPEYRVVDGLLCGHTLRWNRRIYHTSSQSKLTSQLTRQ